MELLILKVMNGQLQKWAELFPCSGHGKWEKDRMKSKGKKQRMKEGARGVWTCSGKYLGGGIKKGEGMEKSGKGVNEWQTRDW